MFFLFLVVFKSCFKNPDAIENVRPQLAPIIPAGAPITVANYAIEMLPANIDKKEAIYLRMFLLISSAYLMFHENYAQWNCVQPFLHISHKIVKVIWWKKIRKFS